MAKFLQLATTVSSRLGAAINTDTRKQFERDAAFVVLLGVCLFLLTALVSFQPFEGWLFSSAPNNNTTSSNLTGPTGNSIAGALIFYMGLSAFTLPVLILQLAWQLRAGALRQSVAPIIAGWLTLLISLMPILSSMQPLLPMRGVSLASGGALGVTLLTSLHDSAGVVGAYIILWTALCSSFIMISQTELAELATILRRLKKGSIATRKSNPQPSNSSGVSGLTTNYDVSPISNHSEALLSNPSIPLSESNESPLNPTSAVHPGISDPIIGDGPTLLENHLISVESPQAELHDFRSDQQEFASQQPYVTPAIETFRRSDDRSAPPLSQKELEATGAVLTKTLSEFGIEGKIVGWQPGPVVTVYEYQPDAGIKQSKIISLMDDLALSLKVDSIFINPVPGKRALGIQVPNQRREIVFLGDVLASDSFQKSPSPLTFAMGKTISGLPFTADLTTMPHLLAAGATGTGKSVGINSLLCSVIMKSSPDDVRMILVDPKMLELSVYDGIPHLLMPVITEPDRASSALKWAANEMERRYKIMQHAQVRNIGGFNSFWDIATESRREQIRGLMNDPHIARLPYILLVIDELADLMLTAPKDVESSIQRLAQKARASGIHMVLATQRPSVDVITGVIKANLPCRLSFQVVSKHDSRTILDQMGAEKLLGRGDLLLQRPGVGRLERIQGALVSDEEVLALVAETKRNYDVIYDERAMTWIDQEVTRSAGIEELNDAAGASALSDPKWDEAINIARTHGVISASFLQRHLQIGYNRAARIVEAMEAKNLVAKAEGSKPRRWLGGP